MELEQHYSKIKIVVTQMIDYVMTHDKNAILPVQDEIKHGRDLLDTIKFGGDNTPFRYAIFLLNHYGEYALNNAEITIINDDLNPKSAKHNNTYRLTLKDFDTHEVLLPGNPTKEDEPYDFITKFISQTTIYSDGHVKDTTATPYDSFLNNYDFHDNYKVPSRKIDFKSFLWRGKTGLHNANYFIKILKNGTIQLLDCLLADKAIKVGQFTAEQKYYYEEYLQLARTIGALDGYSWDYFILDGAENNNEEDNRNNK